jgi:hypothetical protein
MNICVSRRMVDGGVRMMIIDDAPFVFSRCAVRAKSNTCILQPSNYEQWRLHIVIILVCPDLKMRMGEVTRLIQDGCIL